MALGRFDGEIQMFVDAKRDPSLSYLRFLRWAAENQRLEHDVKGPEGGNYAYIMGKDTTENDKRAGLDYSKTASIYSNWRLTTEISEILKRSSLCSNRDGR